MTNAARADALIEVEDSRRPPREAMGPPEVGWSLTAHCCIRCRGRVLRKNDVWMCASCELAHTGSTPTRICACGTKLGDTKRAAGFRCHANDRRGGGNWSAITVLFGGIPVLHDD